MVRRFTTLSRFAEAVARMQLNGKLKRLRTPGLPHRFYEEIASEIIALNRRHSNLCQQTIDGLENSLRIGPAISVMEDVILDLAEKYPELRHQAMSVFRDSGRWLAIASLADRHPDLCQQALAVLSTAPPSETSVNVIKGFAKEHPERHSWAVDALGAIIGKTVNEDPEVALRALHAMHAIDGIPNIGARYPELSQQTMGLLVKELRRAGSEPLDACCDAIVKLVDKSPGLRQQAMGTLTDLVAESGPSTYYCHRSAIMAIGKLADRCPELRQAAMDALTTSLNARDHVRATVDTITALAEKHSDLYEQAMNILASHIEAHVNHGVDVATAVARLIDRYPMFASRDLKERAKLNVERQRLFQVDEGTFTYTAGWTSIDGISGSETSYCTGFDPNPQYAEAQARIKELDAKIAELDRAIQSASSQDQDSRV